MLDKIFSRDKALEKKVCKKCGGEFEYADAEKNYMICPGCDTYFRMTPKERIALVCDSFKEKDKDLKSKNILSFPGYDEKLDSAYKASGCNDAVTYKRHKICYFCNEFLFYDGQYGKGCRRKNFTCV